MGTYMRSLSDMKWTLACFATAALLAIAPICSRTIPCPVPDSLLYTNIIQKGVHGDASLYEHQNDSASIFSFYRLWPDVYHQLYFKGGHGLLLFISILLSGLWMASLFQICRLLGQSDSTAFFIAGLQTFFVVNFAYQFMGFRGNLGAYNFWCSEHLRLYPSVTAMAFYMLAVLAVMRKSLWSIILVPMVYFGRPFDFMVLFGALLLFVCLCPSWKMFSILMLSLQIVSIFVIQYFAYQCLHHAAFMEQLARGSLQIKEPMHYVKYTALCAVLIPWVIYCHKKKFSAYPFSHSSDAQAHLFLCCLCVSSLLVHYRTILDGVTICGPTYLMVFSTIPWFFLLTANHFRRYLTT